CRSWLHLCPDRCGKALQLLTTSTDSRRYEHISGLSTRSFRRPRQDSFPTGNAIDQPRRGSNAGAGGYPACDQQLCKLAQGVSAFDPLSFVVSVGFLLIAALVACYIPARHAMRVDPMVALRYE